MAGGDPVMKFREAEASGVHGKAGNVVKDLREETQTQRDDRWMGRSKDQYKDREMID